MPAADSRRRGSSRALFPVLLVLGCISSLGIGCVAPKERVGIERVGVDSLAVYYQPCRASALIFSVRIFDSGLDGKGQLPSPMVASREFAGGTTGRKFQFDGVSLLEPQRQYGVIVATSEASLADPGYAKVSALREGSIYLGASKKYFTEEEFFRRSGCD